MLCPYIKWMLIILMKYVPVPTGLLLVLLNTYIYYLFSLVKSYQFKKFRSVWGRLY